MRLMVLKGWVDEWERKSGTQSKSEGHRGRKRWVSAEVQENAWKRIKEMSVLKYIVSLAILFLC